MALGYGIGHNGLRRAIRCPILHTGRRSMVSKAAGHSCRGDGYRRPRICGTVLTFSVLLSAWRIADD